MMIPVEFVFVYQEDRVRPKFNLSMKIVTNCYNLSIIIEDVEYCW